jgi:hypothetical protein
MKHNHIDYSDYYAEGGKVDKSIPLKIRKEIYDNDGERRIDERAIEVLTEYAENLPQTKDLNTSKTTGDYYPERKKLHAKIMDSFKKDLICIQTPPAPPMRLHNSAVLKRRGDFSAFASKRAACMTRWKNLTYAVSVRAS